MPHPLETGTLRILKPDGSTAGTGFLVSKRLAVTCAHVITSAKAKPGDVIKFKFHLGDLEGKEAKVLENGWSTENDVAILELTEKLPKWIRPIIMQPSRAMEGRAFQGLGYPNDGPVQTRWPQGNISGRVEVIGYSNPLLQIQGKEIDKGLSGSAVVDHTTRRVIGMITAYQDVTRPSTAENVRFGYAIPIETVWKIYPDLEEELPPLPKRSSLVEGIHLLPNGYDFRIQNFLSEYLGTPEQPEPFGGREDALKALDNWLDGDIQRLVLAAPAGRGKSALLVRWLDRLVAREDLALVFVPISVRFRTNLASTFFASLAARLAYLHGEDVPASETTSTDVWRGLANTYLTKPLSDQRKLLVVIDGLDEAGDWEATSDLFPTELPKNVRVVVSARLLAGDTDSTSWLSRLGWEHTSKASTHELSPLDSSSIADVLLRMGLPLDELSRRVDVVSELYRLSEGDPLLVNLYVEDLWSRGQEVFNLQPEDLRNINSGYEGYFERWWNEQKKLWGKEAPLREQSVRLVFNLLCGAMGGLTKDNLVALDSLNELNSYAIEDAFDALKRFVIGIPDERRQKEVGYVLTHPKLSNYFSEKLSKKEWLELDSHFVVWGEKVMRNLIEEKIKPSDTPRYVLQYYLAHLKRSKAPVEKYLPLLDYPYWRQSWFNYEGAYGSYLQDIIQIRNMVFSVNQQAVEKTGNASLSGKQIHCALIEVSLHEIAERIPAELVAQFVRNGVWTSRQALAYGRQNSLSASQANTFILLSESCSEDSLQEILFEIRGIKNKFFRGGALCAFARRLTGDQRNKILDEAISVIREIDDEASRSNLLEFIARQLPDNMLPNVLPMALEIENAESRNAVLHTFIERLPQNSRVLALTELAEKSPQIQQNNYFKDMLIIAKLRNDEEMYTGSNEKEPERVQKVNTVNEALELARNLNPWDRAVQISSLSEQIPQDQRIGILIEELSNLQKINRAGSDLYLQFFKALGSLIPEEMLNNISRIAKQDGIEIPLFQINSLAELDNQTSDKVNELAVSIQRKKFNWDQVETSIKMIGQLPVETQDEILSKVLDKVREIDNDWYRAYVLRDLIGKLPDRFIGNILEIATRIEDKEYRAHALSVLSKKVLQLNKPQQFEILCKLQLILTARNRRNYLSDLNALLPLIVSISNHNVAIEIFNALHDVITWSP